MLVTMKIWGLNNKWNSSLNNLRTVYAFDLDKSCRTKLAVENNVIDKEKMVVARIFHLPYRVLKSPCYWNTKGPWWPWSCSPELSRLNGIAFDPSPDDKILDWSKLKQIADDISMNIWIENTVPYRVENIVRKGKIACYKQVLLFLQYFPQLYIYSASNCSIVW